MNHNIFDGAFNGMAGSEQYRAAVAPELFPDVKPMRLSNWPQQDLEMYVGGKYMPGYPKEAA